LLALFRQYNDIISLIDWMPTLCAAAGVADIREKMRNGFAAGNKTFRVHLDGYDFGPYFRGEPGSGPRDALYYFDQGGKRRRGHDPGTILLATIRAFRANSFGLPRPRSRIAIVFLVLSGYLVGRGAIRECARLRGHGSITCFCG
jgi:hypothetical protein